MNWVLDHLRLIIAAAGGIAWWLNQRKQARATQQAKPQKEAVFGDPDLAERTRRIREEIQRKIEQRTKEYRQSTPSGPAREAGPPVVPEVANRRALDEPPVIPKPGLVRAEAQRNAEILEQQAALAENLRQAMQLKAATARRVHFENQISNEEPLKPAAAALTEDLRNPAALRRAFILREIIGPPVALR